jgi:tetratricopeptide (TPR) repeat protein
VLAALDRSQGSEPRIPLELVALSRAALLRPYGLEQARYLRAMALSGLGRHADALAWLRFGFRGSPQEYLYLAPVHVRLGEVFESLGQSDSAIAHYNRFLGLWTRPDPEAGPLVEDVRARVDRLKASAH